MKAQQSVPHQTFPPGVYNGAQTERENKELAAFLWSPSQAHSLTALQDHMRETLQALSGSAGFTRSTGETQTKDTKLKSSVVL